MCVQVCACMCACVRAVGAEAECRLHKKVTTVYNQLDWRKFETYGSAWLGYKSSHTCEPYTTGEKIFFLCTYSVMWHESY